MNTLFYQIDAFTDKIFSGNPAGVCPLDKWIDDEIMQQIATENNLPETAFFVEKENVFEITWFTPTSEVDLCGHATLATAYVLFHHLGYDREMIHFKTRHRGDLWVQRSEDLIELDFPSSTAVKTDMPQALKKGLKILPHDLYLSRDYLAVYETEEEILSIKPDFEVLKELDVTGIIVTAPGNNSDFVSRFFAPGIGIPEDPVTGSAHTTLIPYWATRLDKTELHAFQVSQRGGELFCKLKNDRVLIAGKAVTYLIGEITF